MSDNKRIAKNTVFLYIRMLFVMLVNLYTSRIILKNLGIEDYGIYNVVGGIVTMFTFLNGSLGAATSRYITFELGRKNFGRLSSVFNVALIIHICIAFIIVLLSETVGLWFFYEKMIIPAGRLDAAFWVYQISILTCFLSLTQVPYNATIIAHENMRIYAWVGIGEVIGKLVIVYLLLISPVDRLVFYALLLCILQISVMLFYRIFCNRNYPESKIRICRDKSLYREMFGYAGSDLIGNISVLAQGQGLNILLNMFFGPAVNAARGIAYQVQGAVTQFSNNFMTAVKPQIIKLYAEGKTDDMMRLVNKSSCFSYYLMWIITFPIFLECDYILTLWLGKYPEHTVDFLRLILVLCLIQTLKTPRTTVFHATGHIKLTNIIVGSILCAVFPLAYLFLKLGYSPESVFWASNITMIFSEFASVIVLKRYVRFSARNYLMHVHVRCFIVTAVSFVIPYLIYRNLIGSSFVRLVLTVCITTVFSCITIWFVGFDKGSRLTLKKIIKRKFVK